MFCYAKKNQRWAAVLLTISLLCSFWCPVSVQAVEAEEDSSILVTEESESAADELHGNVVVSALTDAEETGPLFQPAEEEKEEEEKPLVQPVEEAENVAATNALLPDTEAPPEEENTSDLPADPDAEVLFETPGGDWVAGTLAEAFAQVDGGTIKLLRDITVNNNDNIALRISRPATLLGENHSICLERGSIVLEGVSRLQLGKEGYGKTLTVYSKDDSNCVFDIRESAIMHMYDGVTIGPSLAGGQPAGVFLQGTSAFYMHGGCITDCKNWATVTGGVLITDNAMFHLSGGTIQNCSGYFGGAVGILTNSNTASGTHFTMSGGEIRNCSHTGSRYGGGAFLVYTAKPVGIKITGGKISNCSAPGLWGGGLYVYVNHDRADINISGVEISGCSAKYGGGMLLAGGNTYVGDGTVLRNNAAESEGGGIWALQQAGIRFGAATITENSASVGGGMVLSGGTNDMTRAVIYHNTASVGGDDLMLRHGSAGSSSAALPANFAGLMLRGCNHDINGWYADDPNSRWACPDTADLDDSVQLSGTVSTAESGTHMYLKAAHSKSEPKPTEPLTITPADIIVYSGGEGYVGVVTGDGEPISRENGIPEPGYYITLPESLDKLLGSDLPHNLSGRLTFYYDDQNGTTRQWDLSLYGTAEHSTGSRPDVDGKPRYVYKMLPGGPQQAPVRVQITDPETGKIVLNDSFLPTASQEYKEYDMTIYPGGLKAGYVSAKLVIGDKSYICPVQIAPGKLVVRGVNQQSTFSIVAEESALSPGNITALSSVGTTYFINSGNVQLTDADGARLLVDTVPQQDALTAYAQAHHSGDLPPERWGYETQYLDLVDIDNGNANLTLSAGQQKTIYWPVPSDWADHGRVQVLHFAVLNRSRSESMSTLLEQTPPWQIIPETVTVNGNRYFKFDTNTFATFVLMYEKAVTNGTDGTTIPDKTPAPGETSAPEARPSVHEKRPSEKPAVQETKSDSRAPIQPEHQRAATPRTGDAASIVFWALMMGLSLAVAAFFGILYEKRGKHNADQNRDL